MSRKPKLLFFISEDWYYWSHRRPLALAARDAGYNVVLVTRVGDLKASIEAEGIRVIPFAISRGGTNPLRDIGMLVRLIAVYRRERPTVVHQVAIKPVIFGSIAARIVGVAHVVNALGGLGFSFIARSWRGRILRVLVRLLLRAALSRGVLVLQNADDAELLCGKRMVDRAKVRIVRGSGVDLGRFRPAVEPPTGAPVVVLPARMLWDKGVGEFVAAARRLRMSGCDARFVLVGGRDEENPQSIDATSLARWQQDGVVEWWGHRDDMPAVYGLATVVCLPSYREGMPKALLEAAACGIALVTTDVPGCREVVRQGVNGLLVPAQDALALADALADLLADPVRRRRFAEESRALAEREFGEALVVAEFLAIYSEFDGPRSDLASS
jgi:glycosyltransferase involved in cell wall biosynthesis